MIILAVMGGGLALWSTNRGPSRACLDARAQRLTNAEAICSPSSGGTSHSSSSGYRSGVSGASGTAVAAVSRGGFGSAGHAAASAGS